MCDSSRLPGYVEAVSTKSGTVGPQCCIVYDKFHILQHAGQAVDEVRRAEFFRRGGAARDLVRGKRWLLPSGWLNLDRGKRRQLNALFALNRRILKAYLLKESLSQL
jgi:transposase